MLLFVAFVMFLTDHPALGLFVFLLWLIFT
jgi:hypothetical protein